MGLFFSGDGVNIPRADLRETNSAAHILPQATGRHEVGTDGDRGYFRRKQS